MMHCLVVDKMHESLLTMLQEIGVKATILPTITRAEIMEQIRDYDGLIIRSKTFVDAELLKNAMRLKFVARAGSGVDNLDVDYLNSKSIAVLNAPEGNRDAVGEHTIGLILALLHNLPQGNQQVTDGIWDREGNRGQELGNKTVGIIGYGNMGASVAKKLQSFGCKVIAYDRYHSTFKTDYAQSVTLKQLRQETDILSLHAPLTQETFKMTEDDFFFRFKKNLIFINTSRGELASFNSIEKAIKKGKIVCAGLDVLENENLATLNAQQQMSFEFLKSSKKVIFTPHVAGWSAESYKRINKVLVKKIKGLF